MPSGPVAAAPDLLSDAQRAAVLSDAKNIAILAGAGTGKTRTLTQRVAHLVRGGVRPESIVLVTFTNRAAREMIGRIERALGEDARRVRAGTFHALAYRALSQRAEAVGYAPGFGIADADDRRSVMRAAIEHSGVRDPLGRDRLIELASFAASTGQALREVIAKLEPTWSARRSDLDAILRAYTKEKMRANVMDFDDLLLFWRALLGAEGFEPDVSHVLVDEYQDTNRLQVELVERLSARGAHVCAVGDEAQAIFGFRGARPEHLLEWAAREDVAVFRLDENYRSSPGILALASAVARRPLIATRPESALPAVIAARDAAEEARFIAHHAAELAREGVPFGEQAVLYRAHAHGVPVQLELARQGIPHVVRGAGRYFERAHVRDVLALLRAAHNPADTSAWRRLLAMVPGVGEKTAAKVIDAIHEALALGHDPGVALTHAPVPVRVQAVLTTLADDLRRLAMAAESVAGAFEAERDEVSSGADDATKRSAEARGELASRRGSATSASAPRSDAQIEAEISSRRSSAARASDVSSPIATELRRLSDETRVPRSLLLEHFARTYPDVSARVEDLGALVSLAETYGELEVLLCQIALLLDVAGDELAQAPGGALTLSTVHQAKGLEWRAVFVAGLAEGSFPIQAASFEPDGEAEERRLFYVAATRARERLFLLHPANRILADGSTVMLAPSRFLWELPAGSFERWSLEK